MTEGYLAFDLGAESGRAMLATLRDGRLELAEVHRFANTPQRLPSGLHWNLGELWAHLVEGLRQAAKAAAEREITLVSLGVDTWGVDYALVGRSGQLLGLPFAYRDERNAPAMKRVLHKLGAEDIYDATGIQFMPFNTLYQLYAQHRAEPRLLDGAKRLLMMPDLLHYFFSGEAVNEATIASTTQMVDPRPRSAGGRRPSGKWDKPLLKRLGLPRKFLHKLVPAGTPIGTLRPEVAREAGLDDAESIRVIVPGSHDTASAVAAVPVVPASPLSGPDPGVPPAAGDGPAGASWAYLSSGTWSLMGAELERPIITAASREAGFTNERGVGGKIRFLKNIAGLWLVQECRRDLARAGEEYSYPQLATLAEKAEPFRTLVHPAYEPFAAPGDMLAKVRGFAATTGQPEPETPGQFVRACLEGLALTYRATLDALEGLLGRRIATLHIVGGGGQNRLLNQLTADALDRPVVVGPFEATAIGNALTQAMGHGRVRDLTHLRQIVRASFEVETYTPHDAEAFTAQRTRFAGLLRG